MKRLKPVLMIAVWIVALALVALAVRLSMESVSIDRETDVIKKGTERIEKVLEAARLEAREVVRAKLRRDEMAAAKADAGAAKRTKAAARKRRAQVRKFFASRGFEATSSYRQSVAMPKGDPSETDREIIDLAGEAASEADLDTAADVLAAALESKDPRARLSAVEMLSGLGEAGLPDISEFLKDPHPEVANLAADRWELGIQELTDEREQAALAKVGFLAIADEDQLRSLGGTLMLVSDSKLAVDVLRDVIRDGTSAQRAAAREAYEGVTGEKWVDEQTALAWLDANYVPPEPEENDAEANEPESSEMGTEESDGMSETTQQQENDNESD